MRIPTKSPNANQSNARAVQLRDASGRLARLECPCCQRRWDVRGRGSATGFIVAAADQHAAICWLRHQSPTPA